MTLRTTPELTTFLMNLSELTINETMVMHQVKKIGLAQPHAIAEELELSIEQTKRVLAYLVNLDKVREVNHPVYGLAYEAA